MLKTRVVYYVLPMDVLLLLFGLCAFAQSTSSISNSTRTDGCDFVVPHMLSMIDSSVNPCDDFYEYACGSYKDATSVSGKVSKQMAQIKTDLLSSNARPSFEAGIKAKAIYKQCQSVGQNEQTAALTSILRILNDTIGGWPLMDSNWIDRSASSFNATRAQALIAMGPESALLDVDIRRDFGDTSKFMITIDQPSNIFIAPLGGTVTDEQMESYVNTTTAVVDQLLRFANVTRNSTDVIKAITNLVELGTTLSAAANTPEEWSAVRYTRPVTSIDVMLSTFSFKSSFMGNITSNLRATWEAANLSSNVIDGNTRVMVLSPRYVQKLDEKLYDMERLGDDGKLRLAGIFGWRILQSYFPFTSLDFTMKRRESCSSFVSSNMGHAVNALYAQAHVSKPDMRKVQALMRNVKNGTKQLIANAKWMDPITRAEATRKIDNMLDLLMYPDAALNNLTAIDAIYQEVQLGDSYIETAATVYRSNMRSSLAKLGQEMPRGEELDEPFDTLYFNAFYEPEKNMMIVASAVVQSPYYNDACPAHVNYGSPGSMIGHEITHSLDTGGSHFDDQGNLRNWWKSETRAAFDFRRQDIVDQYNNYSLSVGNVNGALTQSENTADNGGAKAALVAYHELIRRDSGAQWIIPGLDNFTNDQLFFLSFAQGWCSHLTDAYLRKLILTNGHSPPKFRVNGPVSNMPEFSEAFHCPVDSSMNPANKRSVW